MRLAFAVLALVTGCDLYFTDGDDKPCPDYAHDVAPAELYRDPYTGECRGFGGYPCDDRCGPCPAAAEAQPDWGSCYSACEGLAEDTCMATPGCFAAYMEYLNADQGSQYYGCWQTAPSGPVQGSCTNLDAQECSRHDDCTAHYVGYLARRDSAATSEFTFCAPEHPTSCSGVTCGPGAHCEEQCDASGVCKPLCVPDGDLCAAIDCAAGYECVEVCSDGTAGNCGSCSAQCVPSTTCEALATEAECTSRADCTPVYLGEDCTCYPGYCECNILTYERCETR